MLDLEHVSDKIPKELIKPRKFWHSDGSHIVNVINLSGHARQYIPLVYQDRFCYSMGQEGHNGTATTGSIPICGGCRRPRPWFGHFCVGCGDFFIRDFADPRFCNLYPTCWNCLPELPWASCPDHGPRSDSIYYALVAPPTGLNPRKFTPEELADADDFLEGLFA